jgi:hypothetical protein
MKIFANILSIALVLGFVVEAQAQRRSVSASRNQHEIQTYSTRGAFESGKACKNCDSGTVIDVGGAYLYTLDSKLQVGGDARLRSLSKEASGVGKSVTVIDLIGIGVFNFQPDFDNAFYAKGGIGLYAVLNDNGTDYENKLGLQIGGGKRFPLFSNVTYNPELNLIKRGDIDFGIEIKLINLGISW